MQRPTPRDEVAISTILTPAERVTVDAAGEGSYHTIHRDGLGDLIGDIKARRVDAVLLSVARCDTQMRSGITAMVREFPTVSTVALVSHATADAPRTALTLGSSGITQLVDVREPTGWNELRRLLLSSRNGEIQRESLSQLSIDLAGVHPECWHFFSSLFGAPPRLATVRALSEELGVLPSTLMSRFYRFGLPAPKRYLAIARLIRAARLFENPGFSIANVANHLDYSSPQSFGRHVRSTLRMSAGEFRDRFDGRSMLRFFRETMVLPYLPELRRLRPMSFADRGEPG